VTLLNYGQVHAGEHECPVLSSTMKFQEAVCALVRM
jgi:hypothetical protein